MVPLSEATVSTGASKSQRTAQACPHPHQQQQQQQQRQRQEQQRWPATITFIIILVFVVYFCFCFYQGEGGRWFVGQVPAGAGGISTEQVYIYVYACSYVSLYTFIFTQLKLDRRCASASSYMLVCILTRAYALSSTFTPSIVYVFTDERSHVLPADDKPALIPTHAHTHTCSYTGWISASVYWSRWI